MKKMMMLTTTAYMSERFNRDNILILEHMGYEVHVVANFITGNPSTPEIINSFKKWVEEHHGLCYNIPITAHPTDIVNLKKSYYRCMELIKENKYDFIHCHTPVGGVLGRILAHNSHTKIIYTAHGFHFFKGAPLKNWLLYYPVEKFLSRWTDIILLINHEDYYRAKSNFHARKTEYLPGVGVDLSKFEVTEIGRVQKRIACGWKEDEKILLSVGELSTRKNHKIVLRALKKMKNPQLKYVLCGNGILESELKKTVIEYQLEKQVEFLGYRTDISELCQAADLFVFPSLQEGLSLALMEAIACRLPVVCSNIRGNVDLITDKRYLFTPTIVEDLADTINFALSADNKMYVDLNYKKLRECDLINVRRIMEEEYSSIIHMI